MERSVSGESRLLVYDAMVVGTQELASSVFGLVYFVVFCVIVHTALCHTSKTSLLRCENLAYHLKSFPRITHFSVIIRLNTLNLFVLRKLIVSSYKLKLI